MSGIFIYSENLSLASQLIQAANLLGEPVHVVTHQIKAANILANYPVQTVHLLQGSSTRPEDYADGLASLVKAEQASILLIGDTICGRELAAKTAAILDAGLISGASKIELVAGKVQTSRIQYGGAVVKKEQVEQFTVITIPAGKYPACANSEKQAPIINHQINTDTLINQVNITPIERQGVTLDKSKIVVGVGLGFNNKEDLSLVDELVDLLNAAVGCTRPVADDKKWLPTEQYIGISGANIHPNLYLAFGISGQIQHMVGVRDSKLIVAVNKNENAPIFKSSDYGIVGDLYQIIPSLFEAIKSRGK